MTHGHCVIGRNSGHSGERTRLRNICNGCTAGDTRFQGCKRWNQHGKMTTCVVTTLRDMLSTTCKLSLNEVKRTN